MKIYLDSCSLQRPLDDQTQPRIRVETEAILSILAAAQAGDVVMVNSEALEYETRRIPDVQRRSEVAAILDLSKERIEITDEAEKLAESLEIRGIRPMDAIHLALASTARVDFFTTCDDRLLRKARAETGLGCKVVSALTLVSEALR
ncbi:type II toxin-antitoxin system VapC family toxin [Thiorhodococcus mannitoliphagus]|uniref:Type II toxin-antitoxin system VapC family toxin n=1 Tax=Thiorhodococcus mannitoliphagus TaxID=329406 RepID=A0A6P1E3M3_9GAMM|nr:PIN domain-containing protein [Thiorhodococcus mannitoliphagus]NEX23102.1 type II toxin-antitoxin system VapC family toxin [Thiorhodococcus mannitoliphagus]